MAKCRYIDVKKTYPLDIQQLFKILQYSSFIKLQEKFQECQQTERRLVERGKKRDQLNQAVASVRHRQ